MGAYIIKGEFIYDNDMVNLVLQNISYGSVWKNIRLVSKNIYLLSIKYQESKLIELANPILTLMYKHPENGWDLFHLIYSGIIPIDFIRLTYNKISWTKRLISMSTGITIEDVINSDPDSIYWKEISRNPSIKVSDMLDNDYLPWDYRSASDNKSIRIEDIRNKPDKEWDYNRLTFNSSLSIEDLSTIIDFSINTYWLSNGNTTYKDVIKYSGKYSHAHRIVRYILLDEDILQEYIDRNPNIEAVYIYYRSITPNIIRNNPQLDWDHTKIDYSKFTIEEMMNIPITNDINIERILYRPDFTIDDFSKYFNIDTFTYWRYLSRSPWLTFDIVLKYKDIIHWDHVGLTKNPNVTVDILEDDDFSWITWNYSRLSRYAQLNWVYIDQHSNKDWNSYRLSNNESLVRT